MIRVKEDNKNLKIIRLDGGGVPIYEYQGKLLTGVVYDLNNDGSVAWFEEYKDGYQEGWIKYYFENGKLKQESKKANNIVIAGTFKEWDENGNLIDSFKMHI